MDMGKLRLKPLDEVRKLYKEYLISQKFAQSTINISSDAFYLWNNGSKELFWDTVLDFDFDQNAKETLLQCLRENSSGDADKLIHGYMSHLRRFRRFLATDETALEVIVSNPSHKSYGKNQKMTQYWRVNRTTTTPMHQHTRRTKHLNHRDAKQQSKYNPHYSVALQCFR